MISSSPLIDDTRPLVLDTSVLINVHASGYGERIFAAIPNELVVPEIVARELEHETSRENGEHGFLKSLEAAGLVTIESMSDSEQDIFAGLVSGSLTLDDGEASAIAIAAGRKFLPIVDERKGQSRALAVTLEEPGWTLDLILHPMVSAVLSAADLAEAVYLALRDARMRIREHQCDQVVELIGISRAIECRSLPDFKTRCREWQARLTEQTDLASRV